MSNFFSSEQVQEGLDEIAELQYEIQKDLAETGLIEACLLYTSDAADE